jgi:alanine racemase
MISPEQAGAHLHIDLDAIVGNYRELARRAAPADCAAVLKADAYGLGAARVGPALAAAGCRQFFVAHLSEGAALRAVLPNADIAVLHGPLPGTEPEFLRHRLTPVLSEPGQVDAWGRLARESGGLEAMLHVDAGMNRLGLAPADVAALGQAPERLDGIAVRLVLSHLASAEAADDPMNRAQRQRFEALRAQLPPAPASLANSSGIFLSRDFHYDMVRAGAALYGVNPTPGTPHPLREVVRLRGRIIQLREIDTAESVGYGAAFRAQGPCRIATVPVGYADGYLRALSNQGLAYVAGMEVPVVGRVSMDLITIDVTATPPGAVNVGDFVELIGGGIALDDVAERAGTIGYEILTALGHRYARIYHPSA